MDIRFTETTDGIAWDDLVRDLVRDAFHNERTAQELARSFDHSHAVAFAWHDGRVIGKARAISDGVCNALVVDVWTETPYRRRGVARELMARLEAKLVGQHVCLFTDDAAAFYEAVGYERGSASYEKVVGRWLGRLPPKRPD